MANDVNFSEFFNGKFKILKKVHVVKCMFSEFSKKICKEQWCGVLKNFQKSKEFSKFERLGFLKNFAMANDMFS